MSSEVMNGRPAVWRPATEPGDIANKASTAIEILRIDFSEQGQLPAFSRQLPTSSSDPLNS